MSTAGLTNNFAVHSLLKQYRGQYVDFALDFSLMGPPPTSVGIVPNLEPLVSAMASSLCCRCRDLSIRSSSPEQVVGGSGSNESVDVGGVGREGEGQADVCSRPTGRCEDEESSDVESDDGNGLRGLGGNNRQIPPSPPGSHLQFHMGLLFSPPPHAYA